MLGGDVGSAGGGGMEGGGSGGEALRGQVLMVQLLSNWGDVDAVGLCGLEILEGDGGTLKVDESMIAVSVTCDGEHTIAYYSAFVFTCIHVCSDRTGSSTSFRREVE